MNDYRIPKEIDPIMPIVERKKIEFYIGHESGSFIFAICMANNNTGKHVQIGFSRITHGSVKFFRQDVWTRTATFKIVERTI